MINCEVCPKDFVTNIDALLPTNTRNMPVVEPTGFIDPHNNGDYTQCDQKGIDISLRIYYKGLNIGVGLALDDLGMVFRKNPFGVYHIVLESGDYSVIGYLN